MKWWHYILLLLAIVILIIGIFAIRGTFSKKDVEGFQTATTTPYDDILSKYNAVIGNRDLGVTEAFPTNVPFPEDFNTVNGTYLDNYMRIPTIYDSAITRNLNGVTTSTYTIFDMDAVDTQRKILIAEAGTLAQNMINSETAFNSLTDLTNIDKMRLLQRLVYVYLTTDFNIYKNDIQTYYKSVISLINAHPFGVFLNYEKTVLPDNAIKYPIPYIGHFGRLPFYFYSFNHGTGVGVLANADTWPTQYGGYAILTYYDLPANIGVIQTYVNPATMCNTGRGNQYDASRGSSQKEVDMRWGSCQYTRDPYYCQVRYAQDVTLPGNNGQTVTQYDTRNGFYNKVGQTPPYEGAGRGFGLARNYIEIVNLIKSRLITPTLNYGQGWWFALSEVTLVDTDAIKLTEPTFRAQPNIRPFMGYWSNWKPTCKITTNSPGQPILDSFAAKKPNSTNTGLDPAKSLWRGVTVLGTITQKNKDEVSKSIRYSLPFNFSDNTLIERQLRISGTDGSAYISPTFNAMPEFKTTMTKADSNTVTAADITIAVDLYAAINNASNTLPLPGQNFLKYIPYHARNYMVEWFNERKKRVSALLLGAGDSKNPVTIPSPTFDLLCKNGDPSYSVGLGGNTAGNMYLVSGKYYISTGVTTTNPTGLTLVPENPITSGNTATTINILTKKVILDKMAQLHYSCLGGNKRMLRIYDVYQIGDTIFDVRYTQLEKIPAGFQDQISTLTSEYYTFRSYPLSQTEFDSLEIQFQQKITQLYQQEEANTTGGVATNCGTVAQYIKVAAKTPGKSIFLSQIIAVNNAGINILANVKPTVPYPKSVHLYDLDYPSPTQYGYTGIALTGEQLNTRIKYLSTNVQNNKPYLLTDGTLEPRTRPNIYKSELVTTTANNLLNIDYVLFNLGTSQEINVVKLIYPAEIPPSDADNAYTVELLNLNFSSIKKVDLRDGPISASSPFGIANFLRIPRATSEIGVCPEDLKGTFKTARFYATITQAANTILDPANITFTGFSEGEGLSFNPLYNCGFTLPIESTYGNMNYLITNIVYNLNTPERTRLDCKDSNQLTNLLYEHRLTMNTDAFNNSIKNLTGDAAYDFTNAYYYPSSITGSVQLSDYTCGISWTELKLNKTTNQQLSIPLERYGKLSMVRDIENWGSEQLVYNISSCVIYPSNDAYLQDATTTPRNLALSTIGPIHITLPVAPKATLTTGNGACSAKTCSDTDVITSLMDAYNSNSSTIKVVRINKAVTPYPNVCEFEAVMGDYSQTPPLTVISSLSMLVDINTASCTYAPVTSETFNETNFINEDTPLLSRIYTYAQQTLQPYMNSFQTIFKSLSTMGSSQLNTANTSSITSIQQSYRANVLAAYGATKLLDGCGVNDTPQCTDRTLLNSFFNAYAQNGNTLTNMTSIIGAGTASGTECDFSVSVDTLVVSPGVTPPVKKTTSQTKGYRCRVQKLPGLGCEFALSTSTYQAEEVYQIFSDTNYSREDSYNVCNISTARVATYNELTNAVIKGAAWDTPGWIYDASGAYSIQNGAIIPATLGLNPKFAVTCIGIKPPNGTSGIAKFNTNAYLMPITKMGPCMEITPANMANVGFRQITSKTTLANPDSYLLSTNTDTSSYSLRSALLSPLDYIDCSSKYAINLMNTAGITGVGNINEKKCNIQTATGFKVFNFKRVDGIYVLDGAATTATTGVGIKPVSYPTIPSLTLTPNIASDADCMNSKYTTATGMSPLIQSGKKVNANTCEYSVSPLDTLPFGDTFKTVSFYNEIDGTSIGIGSMTSSIPATSKYTFIPSGTTMQSLVQSPDGSAASTLRGMFISTYNSVYYTNVTATKTNPQQRVGKVNSIGYDPSKDALIISAKYTKIGPESYYDVYDWNPSTIFQVVYRNSAAPIIYSIDILPAIPAGITLRPLTAAALNNDDDVIARDPVDFLEGRGTGPGAIGFNDEPNRFKMIRFSLKDSSLPYYEIYRLNFYTFTSGLPYEIRYDCAIKSPKVSLADLTTASVYLTDLTGNSNLLVKKYMNITAMQCPTPYNNGIDPATNIAECVLDITKITNNSLYAYPQTSQVCGIGYTKQGEQCILNNNFQDLIQNYCGATPSVGSPRLRIYPGQRIIVDFNSYKYIHGYNFITGAQGKEPKNWTVEYSINGLQWAPLHSITNYNQYPTDRGINQFLETPIFTTIRSTSSWPTPPSTIPVTRIAVVPTAVVEGFDMDRKHHFTRPSIPPPLFLRQEPLYRNPASVTPDFITNNRRMSYLRFRTLETMDSASKFVNMSMFRLYSATEPVSTDGFKFSNFEGSRKLASEGPEALLADTTYRRWVDYNKSPLILNINTTDLPEIVGFRFWIPNAPNSRAAIPGRWLLEGSYDGRSWEILHDMSKEKAEYRNDSTTVYIFSKPI